MTHLSDLLDRPMTPPAADVARTVASGPIDPSQRLTGTNRPSA